MDIEKEIEEVKTKLQTLVKEVQMLEQVRNEKVMLSFKLQGSLEMLEKIKNEEK